MQMSKITIKASNVTEIIDHQETRGSSDNGSLKREQSIYVRLLILKL